MIKLGYNLLMGVEMEQRKGERQGGINKEQVGKDSTTEELTIILIYF